MLTGLLTNQSIYAAPCARVEFVGKERFEMVPIPLPQCVCVDRVVESDRQLQIVFVEGLNLRGNPVEFRPVGRSANTDAPGRQVGRDGRVRWRARTDVGVIVNRPPVGR